MNSQVVELIGRNFLVSELLKAGIEVAEPLRDRGVDLIAYLDIDDDITHFTAIPMQLKVSSKRSFGIYRKYDKFPSLIMVYIWNILSDNDAAIYALTQQEAVGVGDALDYTKTASWLEKNSYVSNRPSKKLLTLLQPYHMTPKKWRTKLFG